MVRLGKCDGADSRGAKKPRRAVSMADMELKLKLPLPWACSDENIDANSHSDLLRLRTILDSEGETRPCCSRNRMIGRNVRRRCSNSFGVRRGPIANISRGQALWIDTLCPRMDRQETRCVSSTRTEAQTNPGRGWALRLDCAWKEPRRIPDASHLKWWPVLSRERGSAWHRVIPRSRRGCSRRE